MRFLKNLTTKNKIFLGFSSVLVMFIALTFYAVSNLQSADSSYTTEIYYTLETLGSLEDAQLDFIRMLNVTNTLFANLGNTAYLDLVQAELLSYYHSVQAHVNALEALALTHVYADDKLPNITIMRNSLDDFYHLGHGLIELAYTASLTAFSNQLNVVLNHNAYQAFMDAAYALSEYTRTALFTMASDYSQVVYTTIITSVIVAVLTVALAIIISLLIANPINKSIHKLTHAAKSIAAGKLDLNLATNDRDEFSVLLNTFSGTVDILNSITSDLIKADEEFNRHGDTDYRIETTKYQNDFARMTNGVNQIIENSTKDTMVFVNAMKQVSEGDFEVTLPDMPGKKMVMPRTGRNIVENIKEVYSSIEYLAGNAGNGKLDVNVDQSKFEGSWSDLIGVLNNLIENIAKPMAAVERSLLEMQRGNFEAARIDGIYKGTFEVVKQAVNDTEEATIGYIREITRLLEAIANGDLTKDIEIDFIGDYAPIKRSLDTILASLNETLSEIHAATSQVSIGADTIAKSAMHLSEGSTRQASSVQQLTVTVEQINEQTKESSEAAKTASGKATNSATAAKDGGKSVENMVSVMDKIKESSDDIGKIIKVIEDISFQTNLLSLNAAVEAARAGEHGRGFSVVAEEVRMLAGKSQKSTQDTVEIIAEDQEVVENGIKAATTVEESFTGIIEDITQISGIVDQIATMSTEQSAAIGDINEAIREIAAVTQSNAATAEESAAAAEELNSQADMLQQKVSFFKLRDN